MSTRHTQLGLLVIVITLLLAACVPSGTPSGQALEGGENPGSLRFVWFTDGPNLEVIKEQVAAFEQQEDIKVEFLVLPYADLTKQLQAQIAGGEPPDVVRLSETAPFRRDLLDITQYLEDPNLADAFFEPALAPVSGPDGELYGVPHDLTMNGPFVNLDLFEQAGIEVPGAGDEPWTWDELLANARKAQQAGGTPYAIAYDRSGHRLAGMLSQFGARLFSEDGGGVALDGRAEEAINLLAKLHADEEAPLDVWLAAGDKYAAANEYFVNGQAPVYFSGNWQLAQFSESITNFEWAAMPNPCAENCGGFPGGKFVTAVKGGNNPEGAAKLIEYLAGKDVMQDYASRVLTLPTRNDLRESGLEYADRQQDMDVYLEDLARTPEATFADQYHPVFGPVADELANQVSRVMAGEGDAAAAIAATREAGQTLIDEANGTG